MDANIFLSDLSKILMRMEFALPTRIIALQNIVKEITYTQNIPAEGLNVRGSCAPTGRAAALISHSRR